MFMNPFDDLEILDPIYVVVGQDKNWRVLHAPTKRTMPVPHSSFDSKEKAQMVADALTVRYQRIIERKM